MKSARKGIISLLLIFTMLVSLLSVFATISFAADEVGITEAKGYLESAYAEWAPVSGADGYNAYVKGENLTDWTRIDDMLIRKYSTYWRVDAVGLKEGSYQIKILPVVNENEQENMALVTDSLTVLPHDRSGFAFSSSSTYKTASGAYNDDGTIISGAQIVYVTKDTAKTCTAVVNGTTYTGFQTILDAKQKHGTKEAICFRIVGLVTLDDLDHISSSSEGLQIKGKSNYNEMKITIEGIGEDAAISGFGMLIRNCGNVEVRNLGILNFMDDGISVDTNNCNLWIHNCDFFYGKAGGDADQNKGDGSLDTKKSQYITYSYNHFWDSGKVHLVGNGTDSVNNLTFHHNWYDHADSRMPRVRCGTVHVYNNFYDGVSKYGIGAAMGSDIFSEANYFLNTKFPMLISLQGSDIYDSSNGVYDTDLGTFSGEEGGMIKAYGNVIVGATRFVSYQENDTHFDAYVATSRDEVVPSSVKALDGGADYNNFDTASDFYSYNVQSAEDAMTTTKNYAGRINGGDLKWTFTEADDTDFEINSELKKAVTNYKSSVVSIGGNAKDNYAGGTGSGNTGDNSGNTGGDSGNTGGSGGGSSLPAGAYAHSFTKDGKNSSFYSITGNTSTSKGSVTYNGETLTTCLKIETETKISFTAPSKGTLTLVFGGSTSAAGKGIKIDGTSQKIDSNNILEITVESGNHTISKDDSINLFYIVYVSDKVEEHTHEYTASVTEEAGCITKGTMTYTCSCGESYNEEIPANGHNYVGGICNECGDKEAENGGEETPDDPNDPSDTEDPKDPTDPDNSESKDEEPKEELNFFQKIWKAIVDFFKKLFGIKED